MQHPTPAPRSTAAGAAGAAEPLRSPYLLVLFSVPLYVDSLGRRHVERLWAKDLERHLAYLSDLTLCSYAGTWPGEGADLVCLEDSPAFLGLRTVSFARPAGLIHALWRAPATALRLWGEVGRCRIVHSSVAAWPIPEAWFVTPIARWRRRRHVIVVESAFWRGPLQDAGASFVRRCWSRLQERAARWCLDRADLAIFTHDGYRQSLLSRPAQGHVIEASWLDDAWVIDTAAVEAGVADKLACKRMRLAFFGRLTREKGVLDAVAACLQLERSGAEVELDIYGEGPLLAELRLLAARSADSRIRLCGTLPYGTPMLERLRTYAAVLVPTCTDEQPRIVYDAFSQGVPVIASDTSGHRQCVRPGVTGLLFDNGSAVSLAGSIAVALGDQARWLAQARACVEEARRHTHVSMHQRRRLLLERLL